jgi:LysR family transcriptional regulator, hydrogen peroxide-inducible genes activator
LPEIAAESELTDPRIELHHFAPPEPKRTIGLAWRKTTTRAKDFIALARLIIEVQEPAEMPTIGIDGLVTEPS